MLFVEERVFVPKSERVKTMEYLHLSHLGFANSYSLARSRYFWVGMKADLEKHIGMCGPCIEFQDCRPFEVELAREQLISAPMQWIGVDLFYFQGSHFLEDHWLGQFQLSRPGVSRTRKTFPFCR